MINDCNNCIYLNMTEFEQRILKDNTLKHICTKYNKRVFHYSQSGEAYYIYPCQECLNNRR